MAVKGENETIAEWYARLKQLACSCKFGVYLEAFVLNQFVMSLPNAIFERMCEEDERLSLSDALRKAMIMETKDFAKRTGENISYVNRSSANQRKKRNCNNRNNGSYDTGSFKGNGRSHGMNFKSSSSDGSDGDAGRGKKQQKFCVHCGWKNHRSEECKYKHLNCHTCGKKGHLASVSWHQLLLVSYTF
ncbi:uncharacterized protein LOC115630372 [Scaptodrosophila lebanonensis]|uniref:Uncharacterized protein LOC115630372 n=1 Tax=Drosophila lebanonensis TaxID=7225 RepID=A0A6J2U2Z0_DROLE|nr:uncharacterized protein LOC115630372 [Scaptodrosophila lebanonensis]